MEVTIYRMALFLAAVVVAVAGFARDLTAQNTALPTKTDQRETPALPDIAVAPAVPDEPLEKRLNAVFKHIPDMKAVKAAVDEGVVRLSGKAESLPDAKEAVRLAERFEGVVFVVNDIRIQPEVDVRFAPLLRKIYSVADRVIVFLPLLFLALSIVFISWFLGRMVKHRARLFSKLSQNRLMQYFLRQLISRLLVLCGIVAALYVLDLTTAAGAVISAAGLFGLVLGFAFRDIAENYLAGILLSVRSPFAVGDRIDVSGMEGKVVRMTMRELILITFEGNHVRIANSEVFKSVIVNYTRNPHRECNFTVGIDTAEDLEHVRAVGCAALAAMTGVIDEPKPFMRVEEFGAYAMVVRFHVWVDQRAYSFRKVRSEAKMILKMALDEAGIQLPPPLGEIILRDPKARAADESGEPRSSAIEAARRVDVSPEEYIDRQIERDIIRSV